MLIVSAAQLVFAAVMIWLGVMGLASGTFGQLWQPIPKWVHAPAALAYVCALIALASGAGLVWRRTAAAAARLLFAALFVWLAVMRFPNLFFETPLVLVAWTFGSTAVMVSAAWVLYVWLAGKADRPMLGGLAGDTGIRLAQALCGLSLIPFGLAHFMYLDATTVLIPNWLPWHAAWAYLTGAAFIAAGAAMIAGVYGRLAASLATLQLFLFSVIVWVPRAWAGNLSEFQKGEFVSTWVLTAGMWVVADSYRRRASR